MDVETDEVQAVIDQANKIIRLFKALDVNKEMPDADQLELKMFDAMMVRMVEHRGESHLVMTHAQSIHLAMALTEIRTLAQAAGVAPPPSEDVLVLAQQLMNTSKPDQN